ncbi:MAG TPA: hypothetical protein ENO13_00475 [Candidatus Bathyarchaeota archaeon]|nr:hypothetical protein [Candidatus Bathyarchaeota archaeon]
MDFEDVVYAASLVLLCYVVLFVPLNTFLAFNVGVMSGSNIAAFLLAGLITGVTFAGKLSDRRTVSIGKILLIVSTFVVFFILTSNVVDWTAYRETYATTWSAGEWAYEMVLMLYKTIALYEVLALSIMFIGIYTGSILRALKRQQ